MSDLSTAKDFKRFTDKNGARWVLFHFDALSNPYLAISGDYSPDTGAASWGDLEDSALFLSTFGDHHPKNAGAGIYVDSRGVSWAHQMRSAAGLRRHYAATTGYANGLAVSSFTDMGWQEEIESVTLLPNPGAAKPPVSPPPTGGVALPTAPAPLTDDDYRGIAAVARFINASPIDLMLVLFRESGLSTLAAARDKNGAPVALGLNQLTMHGGAAAIGLTPEQWAAIPTLSFAQQLDLVRRFFVKESRARLSNATVIYQTNIGPGTVGSDIIYRSPSVEYESNKALDVGNKGYIDTNDLNIFLKKAETTDAFKKHLVRMNALGYPGNPTYAGGVGFGAIAALGLLAGGLVWLARRDTAA